MRLDCKGTRKRGAEKNLLKKELPSKQQMKALRPNPELKPKENPDKNHQSLRTNNRSKSRKVKSQPVKSGKSQRIMKKKNPNQESVRAAA